MSVNIVQVDAFTSRPFAGNPAAVCVLDAPADAVWMQQVACEMNLSETAFLHREGEGVFRLRWFTPAVEVDLCGHATLASAHVLWEEGHLAATAEARFQTRSGLLTAKRVGEWIEMDFPAKPLEKGALPEGLAEALGAKVIHGGMSQFDVLAEVESEACLRGLTPDMTRLAQVAARGVIVTAKATSSEYDFVSRFFAPRAGIAEDPVTGSAHCTLGPYWSERLGKHEFVAYQASTRGGVVRVQVAEERILLSGQALTTLRGQLLSDPPPDVHSFPNEPRTQ